MNRIALTLAVLTLPLLQASCDLDSLDSSRFHEDFQYSYNINPGARLTLETFNGDVDVLSWEKNSIQITGTKYASSQEALKDLRIDIKTGDDSISICTVRPGGFPGGAGAKYFLRVPSDISLDRMVTSNGGVRVEGIRGKVRLETSNGGVRLRQIVGPLEALTSNGSIDADDLDGDTYLRTSNGPIRMDRMHGALDGATSNGSVHLDWAGGKPGQRLRIGTSNGPIEVNCGEVDDNAIDLSSTNGSVTLRLHPGVKADVNATTSHGTISTDFEIGSNGSSAKDSLEGQINGGGSKITISTSNAPIHLQKM